MVLPKRHTFRGVVLQWSNALWRSGKLEWHVLVSIDLTVPSMFLVKMALPIREVSKLLILKLLSMASLTANHVGGWIYYSIAASLTHTVNWKQFKLVIAGNKLLSARKNLVLLGNALTPEVSQAAKAVKPKPWHLPYLWETEEEALPLQVDRVKGAVWGSNAATDSI